MELPRGFSVILFAVETIRIGQIVGAFGIKGELKVEPMTTFVQRFDKGKEIILNGKTVRIVASRMHKGRPLIRLAGIEDANAAEKLQWAYLDIPESERPKLEEDEFVVEELIGMTVKTESGEKLGTLEEVLSNPAHDVFVVNGIMIPAVKEFVKMIDFETETITVRLIPGMRDDAEAEQA